MSPFFTFFSYAAQVTARPVGDGKNENRLKSRGAGRLSPNEVLSLADLIAQVSALLIFTSPLALLVVLAMAYYISDKVARWQVCGAALAAICLGTVGLEVEPVQQGAWDLHKLLYPFVVCKWAVIGFGAGWLSLQLINGVPVKHGLSRSAIFLLLGLFYLTVTVLDRTYSRDVSNDDRNFWTRVFQENQA